MALWITSDGKLIEYGFPSRLSDDSCDALCPCLPGCNYYCFDDQPLEMAASFEFSFGDYAGSEQWLYGSLAWVPLSGGPGTYTLDLPLVWGGTDFGNPTSITYDFWFSCTRHYDGIAVPGDPGYNVTQFRASMTPHLTGNTTQFFDGGWNRDYTFGSSPGSGMCTTLVQYGFGGTYALHGLDPWGGGPFNRVRGGFSVRVVGAF